MRWLVAAASAPLRFGIMGTGQRCMFFAPYIAAHPAAAHLVALATAATQSIDRGGEIIDLRPMLSAFAR